MKEINSKKHSHIRDIGCGEGHTTKQILDRIKGIYVCDLLEPNKASLSTAEAFLQPENNIGKIYPQTLSTFKTDKKYDVVFTSHTNYYWALNQKDYDSQLKRLSNLIDKGGRIIILTLPKESDHYQIMLRQIYPTFNYTDYIVKALKKNGLKVRVFPQKMRMYVGDILNTDNMFDLKTFYRFIHNTDSYPNDIEAMKFYKKIKTKQKANYLDFKDSLIVAEK